MNLRTITGYLYLAFATVFAAGTIGWFFNQSARPDVTGDYSALSSAIINCVLAASAAVVGIMLPRRRAGAFGRAWLWLAVFAAGVGLFKFFIWRTLAYHSMLRMSPWLFIFGGLPLWRMFLEFSTHFMLPVMFVFSVMLLFRSEDTAVAAPSPVSAASVASSGVSAPTPIVESSDTAASTRVKRPSSLFGVLSLVFFGIGIPIGCLMLLFEPVGRNDWGTMIAIPLVAWLAFLCGFISVMVAFIRWERRLIWPLLGYTAGVAPFLILLFQVGQTFPAMMVSSILFCAGCVIASEKTGERAWSCLAAIPSGFAVCFLLLPALNLLMALVARR